MQLSICRYRFQIPSILNFISFSTVVNVQVLLITFFISQSIPKLRMPMPQPPRILTQSVIPLTPFPLSILPLQIRHLTQRQRKTNNHSSQAHRMPERIMRCILLQVDKRANKRRTICNTNHHARARRPHIVRRKVIARPPNHHRAALKHTNSD